MKSQMSSFDIAAIVRELQQCVGLRAEKFFLVDHRDLFFRLTGVGSKKSITINLKHGLWLEDGFRTTVDSEPPTFAMLLRKYLSGAALKAVEQHGFDRIVVFTFATDPEMKLVAELFGTGNLILVREGTIVQPLTSKSWKARDVKAGREYSSPPESPDPFKMDREALANVLRYSKKDLVRCLATEMNLGGVHAEDACAALAMDKSTKASELAEESVGRLFDTIAHYKSQMESPSPHILLGDDGTYMDVLPFGLSINQAMGRKPFASFSEAAIEYFMNLPENTKVPGKSPRQMQLEKQLASQSEAVQNLEKQAEECQRIGDTLYADYSRLDALLNSVSKILSSGNWQAVRKDIEAMEGVSGFEPASGLLKVIVADGLEARLDVRMNLNENAAMFYDQSKKAKHKAQGAMAAVLDTKKLLGQVIKAEVRAVDASGKVPTKKFWFDKFRWFRSSEGFMVVGGRDTRTNDQLVKKHLKDGDIYVHADANGAPSVVIKEGANAGEATLEEACIFAVSFSRAWKSKLASGNAYWVKPDQVSKTPQPGEFVPKGAFIIRGRRNYSKKLEIRLAIAKIELQGHAKIMCGPVASVSALTEEYYVIEPGDEKRSDFARTLSDRYQVPIEEIDRALPPGDVYSKNTKRQ